jgi:hypothetical protein
LATVSDTVTTVTVAWGVGERVGAFMGWMGGMVV